MNFMSRSNTVCPGCGSKKTLIKEKMMGQDTQDFICSECKHVDWWRSFHPGNKDKD